MKLAMLTVLALVAAVPAMAQSSYPSTGPTGTEQRDSVTGPIAVEPESPASQQQAALPEERAQKKHPGTVLKLRGAFMDGPVVEGDQNPESTLGFPEPKQTR